MRVILTEEVPSLGTIGAIVTVKNGYARNYLIPRSLAVVADETHTKELEHRKKQLQKKRDRILGEQRQLASRIEKVSFKIIKQVGEEGRIFGSVTSQDIVDGLGSSGITISKKLVRFPEEIKKTGSYQVEIKLHSEVTAKLSFTVAAATAE